MVPCQRHFVYLRSLEPRWLLGLFCLVAFAAEPEGWRIVDGDIAIPPAGARQAAFGARLWPSGRIPYEVGAGYKSRECLDKAVLEWNTRTVIKLAPRNGETDYLVFTPSPRSFTVVGLIGGPQPVFLEEGECAWSLYRTIVHEIGHSVGLFHEHQRSDRDKFVLVHPEFSNLTAQDLVVTQGSPVGPYDFASVMHYGPLGGSGGAVIETIPRGIPTSLDQGTERMLSAGDLDAIQRIYGEPPVQTTISTNPPGLEVIVDGQKRVTPFLMDWAAGTQHTLEVPSPQTREGARYEFGRWNDEGRQSHTITAGVLTHIAANFLTYVRVRGVSGDAARGSVSVDSPDGSAEPADGLRIIGSSVRVRAQAAAGFFLRVWESGRGMRNPLVFPVFHSDPAVNDFVARFEPYPVTTITSEPAGLRVVVNGVAAITPAQFRFEPSTVQTIDYAPELVTPNARYKLDVVRSEPTVQSAGRIIASVIDSKVVAIYRADYPVRVSVSPQGAGQIVMTPALADGYALAGDRLQMRATPSPAYRFLRWRGAEGDANPLAVTVQGAVDLVAEFIPIAQSVNAISVRNAASALGGGVAPGEIVSIFGTGLPELAYGEFTGGKLATEVSGVRLLVNGVAAPIIAVAPGQVNAIVPYGVAGETSVVFEVLRDGTALGQTAVAVVDAAPALFTADSSGAGPAAAILQERIVVLFGTGEGALEAAVADGSVAELPLSKPRLPVAVEIGGVEARVLYAGPAPGSVHGLLQVNVELPEGVEPGAVPVVLTVGTARSAPGVTILVK